MSDPDTLIYLIDGPASWKGERPVRSKFQTTISVIEVGNTDLGVSRTKASCWYSNHVDRAVPAHVSFGIDQLAVPVIVIVTVTRAGIHFMCHPEISVVGVIITDIGSARCGMMSDG